MVVERCALSRHLRPLVCLVLVRVQHATGQEGNDRVEDGRIAGRLDVVQGCVDHPQPVIGESRPYTLATGFVPPMLHVTLDELSRRRAQQLLVEDRRVGCDEGGGILQLVAEAERAAGLVKRRSSPHAAGECLVGEPAVQHDVHRAVWRADRDRSNESVPERPDSPAAPRPPPRDRGTASRSLRSAVVILRLAKQADDTPLLGGSEVNVNLNGAARVVSGAGLIRQLPRGRAQRDAVTTRSGR